MRIGVQLPQYGPSATRDSVLQVARLAEAAGFDSVWVSDHIVYPLKSKTRYPYGRGEIPFHPNDGYLEALTTLSVVAGATSRLRLGTSVLLLPMRELLLTAKAIATLDVLSGGRTAVAIGVGWWREEFDALGFDFDSRHARLDEQLVALQYLWSDGTGSMDGAYVKYPAVDVLPRPLQVGGPDIWIGGAGSNTWRRIANSKAGWHGLGYATDVIALAKEAIARACEASGRDPDTVALSTATGLSAEPSRAAERVLKLAEVGVSQIVFNIRDATLSGILEGIDKFASHALPIIEAGLRPTGSSLKPVTKSKNQVD